MSEVKILIADDEDRMRKLVSDFLKKEGYIVLEAEDGRIALELFNNECHKFDLIILDIMMTGMDGWSVCKEIRKDSQVPIVMLTAKSEETDVLLGFELGVDDYITKPFSPMILVARVQALLRRTTNSSRERKVYQGLEINEAGYDVFVNGERVDLTPKEFELLIYLTNNEGIALSRNKILSSVWDYDYFGDVRTVDTHIKKLREKLADKGDYIQTVRGLGYKFEV
jgi:two-component system, OmpR family, response regulator ResD